MTQAEDRAVIAPVSLGEGRPERPVRVQRERRAGRRMPDGTIYVGRPKWRNPFRVGDYVRIGLRGNPGLPVLIRTAEQATMLFAMLCVETAPDVSALRGKNLACWCPLPKSGEPDHCHAAVLLRLANPEIPNDR